VVALLLVESQRQRQRRQQQQQEQQRMMTTIMITATGMKRERIVLYKKHGYVRYPKKINVTMKENYSKKS